MGLLDMFGGSPEKLESKGDALLAAGHWGQAKIAFERALDKLEKQAAADADTRRRLTEKIDRARESLAREHHDTAEHMIDGGYFDDAIDMLALAREITADATLRSELEQRLQEVKTRRLREAEADPDAPDLGDGPADADDAAMPAVAESDEDYFFALCAALPDALQEAYLSYGEPFQAGYIALNRGDFQAAAELLADAMEQHPEPDTFIPLELAAAYANLNRTQEAKGLLQTVLAHHPDALPAYELLCDILWQEGDFTGAETLLAALPGDLSDSVAAALLLGETRRRGGDAAGARDLYQGFLDRFGWNEAIARALAGVYEFLGRTGRAKTIYGEVIAQCSGCRTRVDPAVKHKYAELAFAEGGRGTDVLEMFLALARELPENAAVYFDRAGQIYADQGNPAEAARFRAFADRARKEKGG